MKDQAKIQAKMRVKNRVEIHCPYCHDMVRMEPEKTACETCMAWHHRGCWDIHGGCSSCGFKRKEQSPLKQAGLTQKVCQKVGCKERPLDSVEYGARSARFCDAHAREMGASQKKVSGFISLAAFATAILCTSIPLFGGDSAFLTTAFLNALLACYFGVSWKMSDFKKVEKGGELTKPSLKEKNRFDKC
jgi:hypothetical protein